MAGFEFIHKDQECDRICIDEKTGRICSYKDDGSGLSLYIGNADWKKMSHWWKMRAASASR